MDVERVIPVKLVQTSKKGRYLMLIFLSSVLFLFCLVLFKIWPIVTILVLPEFYPVEQLINIKVDLDLKNISLSTNTVPGKAMMVGDELNEIIKSGYIVLPIPSERVVVNISHLKDILVNELSKKIPGEVVVLPVEIDFNSYEWMKGPSGRTFSGQVYFRAKYYQPIQSNKWSREISGLDKEIAREILLAKSGVKEVSIIYFPSFFANLSEKLPTNVNEIRFALDIK